MADDTRDPDNDQPRAQPKGPANTMPGGMAHTAGGKTNEELTYFQVVRNLGPDYYLNFYKRPCVRDSQLNGIAAGFVGGGIAGILRRPVYICTNWGVGTWCAVSCLSYQYCQYWRSKEKDGINQMKEIMEKKRANIEAKREARRKAKDEHDRLEEERRREEQRRRSWGYWINKNVRFW
ncbi:hypothetical protein BDV96DRAFT_481771 [Lophiotrema nucula]|uniref:Cytochrome c oxidase assembly protein COX20, mitochondrial n=1 Tax=Lophiotrema nucula TaxID=690887 RepID=A0A6A5ZSP6_9PLEO|nr:hypothetical protein BDV96DRAFT_481771 [Lophiotrema nucula]